MLSFDHISACIVTRGDVDLAPIIETLPYPEVIIWDNSKSYKDLKTFGRYAAIGLASNEVCYVQDDDTLFRHHQELLDEYEPGMTTAVYGHGDIEAGYGDLPLVCGGGLIHKQDVKRALYTWRKHADEPLSDDFLYDCDFALGVLIPFKHVHLPFEIRDVAYNGRRLADEPWQREAKLRVCNRARWIRDHVLGPSVTESLPVAA